MPKKGEYGLSDKQIDEIRAEYMNGVGVLDLCKRFGKGKSTIYIVVRGLHFDKKQVVQHRLITQLRTVSESDLGWVGGIIDGEGYIGISRNRHILQPRVSVASTTRAMQHNLLKVLGIGRVCKKKARGPNTRPTFDWSLWSLEAILPFLTVLDPYLVVKQRQARLVAEYCRRRLASLSSAYTKQDEIDATNIRKLNLRGIHGSS